MRHSLLEMLQKASQGSAHFVRCIRSNLKCAPFTFDRDLIRYQVNNTSRVVDIIYHAS
jgi:myosin heavy subunit